MRAAGRRRWVEIGLWVIGLSLLGAAAADALIRWSYQKNQERALFQGGPAAPEPAPVAALPAQHSAAASPSPAARLDAQPAREMPVVQESITPPPDKPVRKRAVASDPGVVGRLEIPRLRLRAIVKAGGDEKTLARAVGLIPGSAGPGEPGNMVLAGHRDTFFRPLERIRVDDRVRLVVPPHTYEYRVSELRVVEPEETSVLQSRGVEEVTLVTCYPFDMIGPAPDRFIVHAQRVD